MSFVAKSLVVLTLLSVLAVPACRKKEEAPAPAPAPAGNAGVSVDSAPAAPVEAPPPPPVQAEQTPAADADPNAKPMKLPPELLHLRQLCEKYFNQYGDFPRDWQAMIKAGYITTVPKGPDGKPLDWVKFTQAVANP